MPNPYAHEPHKVVENCLAGLRQTRMAEAIGLTALLEEPGVVADLVLPVKSLIPARADYYLVRFVRGGRPFALATVSREGWLQAAARVDGMAIENLDADVLMSRVRGELGRNPRAVRFKFGWGSWAGGADHLHPHTVVSTDRGEIVVNWKGEIFEDDEEGREFLDLPGGARTLRRVHTLVPGNPPVAQ